MVDAGAVRWAKAEQAEVRRTSDERERTQSQHVQGGWVYTNRTEKKQRPATRLARQTDSQPDNTRHVASGRIGPSGHARARVRGDPEW